MGKHIIVSGATGNLGKVVAGKLISLGYGLHINLRNTTKAGDFDPAFVSTYEADLTKPEQAEAFAANAVAKAGRIDAAVLLAGGFAPGKLEATTLQDIEKMISMNFLTAFNLIKPLKAHFEENGGGQFILVGARPALVPDQGAGSFAYALSKSLLFQTADVINAESKKSNISASVVVPSIIDTPDNREAMPGSDFTKWISPKDMAESIAFILSETGSKMKETVLKLYHQA
ncbi:SDR family NAD(P)-dependent oxidoreductase [Dyadobacter sp. Leaf189]|uniref:SDR family NAD(P)-dependent oxidoreductase n=1 Tax=Dyadobacter sp. Leaf189 TaxID=1736295 RepID=UPI0006FC43CC|nr:SDR family NAD(P)-dependent oxidoreductase [Dyadobacter sp. Leaf189]KQS33306.1 short-chain dehydrogenase [Dyadobacter sp. Leaf189]